MIDIKRAILYGLFMVVAYVLWTDWQKEHPPVTAAVVASNPVTLTATPVIENGKDIVKKTSMSVDASPSVVAEKSAPLAYIETDVMKVGFNLNTGDLVDLRFLNYTESDNNQTPFVMLNNDNMKKYVTMTRLLSINPKQKEQLNDTKIQFAKNSFHVVEDKAKGEWIVSLDGKDNHGLMIHKTMTFKQGQYLIDVHYEVTNQSKTPWEGVWTTQLLQHSPSEDKSSLFHLGSYSGGSLSIPGDKLYKKIGFLP